MKDTELYQRCKDEWEMQVEIFRSCYAKGHNDAKRDIALSGEYERAYQRGRDSVIALLDKIKGYIDHIRKTGMGKKKSLEFIDKFIDGLKAESEEV